LISRAIAEPLCDLTDMDIRFKRLPPHWHYVVSRRQIKEAVADISKRIRVIEFSGTGFQPCKLTAGLYIAGECDSRLVGPDWCFRLRFCGLPENVLDLAADDLTPKILAGVREFLSEHSGNVTTPTRGRRRILFLQSENDVLVPSFETKPLKGWWGKLEQSNPWW
jgi:hypothetical protein